MSNRQGEILLFIQRCVRHNGSPPTRREIADRFDFASPNAAQCHLKAMEEKGLIVLTPKVSRGIKVLVG